MRKLKISPSEFSSISGDGGVRDTKFGMKVSNKKSLHAGLPGL